MKRVMMIDCVFSGRRVQTVTQITASGDTIVKSSNRSYTTSHHYFGSFEKSGNDWIVHTGSGHYNIMERKHYWYLRDRLGSTVAVIDSAASYQQTTGYYASGTPYRVPHTAVTSAVDAKTDRLHIGNRWMSHSGLNWYDNTARMHDPILMRFTTPDPLYGNYPDLSPWSHCAADPLNSIDPSGADIYSVSIDGVMTNLFFIPYIDIVFAENRDFLCLEYGTISNSISGSAEFQYTSGETGTTTYTSYFLNGDGLDALRFFAQHTNVEWDRVEIEGGKRSVIGTSNNTDFTASGAAYRKNNPSMWEKITAYDHTHPSEAGPSSSDIRTAQDFEENCPNISSFRIYYSKNFKMYHDFNSKSTPEEGCYDGQEVDLPGLDVTPENSSTLP